jgi:hypothetical protein
MAGQFWTAWSEVASWQQQRNWHQNHQEATKVATTATTTTVAISSAPNKSM